MEKEKPRLKKIKAINQKNKCLNCYYQYNSRGICKEKCTVDGIDYIFIIDRSVNKC